MGIPVKLQVFEGPLDLLLHLIEKNKVDIYDIPIVEITQQYLEYVQQMKREDLNVVSEFLVMAATLIQIKAKMLLPPEVNEEGQEEDPRAELVQQLLEYKMYKYMSYELKDRQLYAGKAVYRSPKLPDEVNNYKQPVDLDKMVQDVTLQKLQDIFEELLARQQERLDPIRSQFGTIEQEEISVEQKIGDIEEYAMNNRRFSFRKLLKKQHSKVDLVVTFLSILELMKSGKIYIEQQHAFDDIIITSEIAGIAE